MLEVIIIFATVAILGCIWAALYLSRKRRESRTSWGDSPHSTTLFLCVDRDGTEKASNSVPVRLEEMDISWGNRLLFSKNDRNKWYDIWSTEPPHSFFCGTVLPKGTIQRILGRQLTWADEPVQIEAWESPVVLALHTRYTIGDRVQVLSPYDRTTHIQDAVHSITVQNLEGTPKLYYILKQTMGQYEEEELQPVE